LIPLFHIGKLFNLTSLTCWANSCSPYSILIFIILLDGILDSFCFHFCRSTTISTVVNLSSFFSSYRYRTQTRSPSYCSTNLFVPGFPGKRTLNFHLKPLILNQPDFKLPIAESNAHTPLPSAGYNVSFESLPAPGPAASVCSGLYFWVGPAIPFPPTRNEK